VLVDGEDQLPTVSNVSQLPQKHYILNAQHYFGGPIKDTAIIVEIHKKYFGAMQIKNPTQLAQILSIICRKAGEKLKNKASF